MFQLMLKFVSAKKILLPQKFSQFFDVMAHISAVKHLSKISFSYFYTPWPPLTFKAIIFFSVSPSFTSSEKSTVKPDKSRYRLRIFNDISQEKYTWLRFSYFSSVLIFLVNHNTESWKIRYITIYKESFLCGIYDADKTYKRKKTVSSSLQN